jgi:hypothetical protein
VEYLRTTKRGAALEHTTHKSPSRPSRVSRILTWVLHKLRPLEIVSLISSSLEQTAERGFRNPSRVLRMFSWVLRKLGWSTMEIVSRKGKRKIVQKLQRGRAARVAKKSHMLAGTAAQ